MLSEEVVTHFMERLVSGDLKPGDKLPSERTLAENLGVSRTVVREAIKILCERGLVNVQVGKGAYITQPDPQCITESLKILFHLEQGTVDNVIEIRKFLEIPLAGMAAQRVTPANVEEMSSLLRGMERLIGDETAYGEYIQIDLEFHLAIARATQNPLFILLIKPIINLMQRTRWLITRAPRSYERSHFHHMSVFNAIVQNDEAAARAAMAAHLKQVEEDSILMMTPPTEVFSSPSRVPDDGSGGSLF